MRRVAPFSLAYVDETDAPQLPAGYAEMYMVALLPPLWFRVMNPRVDAWRERFYAMRNGHGSGAGARRRESTAD